jgi:hypothetical protein
MEAMGLCSSPSPWWSAACCCWPCFSGWPAWGGATAGGLEGHVGSVAAKARLGALVRCQILPGQLGADRSSKV